MRHLIPTTATIAFLLVIQTAWSQTAKLDLVIEPDEPPATVEDLEIAASTQDVIGYFDTGEESNHYDPSPQDIERTVKAIRIEPKCELPFPPKGVVEIAGLDYGFMLDVTPSDDESTEFVPKDDGEMDYIYYNRLFFDKNRNGDLTDDGVIHGESFKLEGYSPRTWFPRITLPVDVDGHQYEHSMNLIAFGFRRFQTTDSDGEPIPDPEMFYYCTIECRNPAFRVGEIMVDGRKRRIVLIDGIGDGRFDDTNTSMDAILFDPELISAETGYTKISNLKDLYRSQTAKTILLDKKYYDLSITPSGDELTLTPSTAPVGYIVPTHDVFNGMICRYVPEPDYENPTYQVYHFECAQGEKFPVLTGEWLFEFYDLRKPGAPIPGKTDEESQFQSDLATFSPPFPRNPITIKDGETYLFESETPLRPVIDVYAPDRRREATEESPWPVGVVVPGDATELCLRITNENGYRLCDLRVNGARPEPPPSFTIRGPDGREILSDSFEYG